jgi:hypothetical protein
MMYGVFGLPFGWGWTLACLLMLAQKTGIDSD